MTHIDSVQLDSRLAAKIFLVCALSLTLGAVLGVNTWPLQSFAVDAKRALTPEALFIGFQNFSLVLALLFWFGFPSRRAAIWVVSGWILTIAFIWIELPTLRPNLNVQLRLFDWLMFLVGAMAIPATAAILIRIARDWRSADPVAARFRLLATLTVLFVLVPQPALSFSATLHPATFDLYAMHWDAAAGLAIAPALIAAVNAIPGLPTLVEIAYAITPLVFLSVPVLQLRGKRIHVPSALLVWVVLTLCAMTAYHVFPITGPKYIFGPGKFVDGLVNFREQPLATLLVDSYPRNGMPSMHFGWLLAASVMWWQSATRHWSRALIVVTTVLTAVATLYTGEHYTIDLIVAVPFVLSALSLCATGVPWQSTARQRAVVLGFVTWFAWVMFLRHTTPFFMQNPWLCQLLILATVGAVVQQVRWMRRFQHDARELPRYRSLARSPQQLMAWQGRLGMMFFVSGAAALIYQVLFAKELALVFGSTATANLTVLATFLGGMALGSLLGGVMAQKVRRPLVAYAAVEVGIALYCALTPQLFQGVQGLYVHWALGVAPDAPGLLALRVCLGAGVLLLPTVLMGATLPLLADALGPQSGRMGSRVAWLYFANTSGAAIGALLAAYIVIPVLGAHKTTLIAAMLNLLVALGALELAKKVAARSAALQPASSDPHAHSQAWSAKARWAAMVALGLGGVLSLGLEVVYVHMLSIVAGNSVYAFGLMVATFLFGLAVGGEIARRCLLRPQFDTASALVMALLCLSIAVTLGATLWNVIPAYFASYADYPIARSFSARETVRGLVCAWVMVPPTVCIGATYVFAMDIVTSATFRPKTVLLGWGAALNTAGNIIGVLLFGFVLLPAWGGLEASRVIAGAAGLLAIVLLILCARHALPRISVLAGLAAVTWNFGGALKLDLAALSSGANVYFYSQAWGEVVDHAESVDGGLTTVTRRNSPAPTVHTLLTNGKFQGNDAEQGEVQAQIGFALAPLLHQDKRDAALVIGYGTGSTSRAFHDAGFSLVDIAELSADIVRLADRYFEPVNHRVSRAPNVRLNVTDGRNLLLLSQQKYDVISIEITSIWFAGAASLYNQDFYRLARSRMSPQGVLQQWVQMHRLSPLDILTIVSTIRSEFRYVSFYLMGDQGILVATNDQTRSSATPQALTAITERAQLSEVRRIAGRDMQALVNDRVLDADGVDRFITGTGIRGDLWISTDDNLRLEYSTPRANVNDAEKSSKANRAMLERFR